MSPLTSIASQASVVIDWSGVAPSYQNAETHTNIDLLLSWVRSYPERRRVHVYLRRSQSDRDGRTLQNALQALGCTVTTRAHLLA